MKKSLWIGIGIVALISVGVFFFLNKKAKVTESEVNELPLLLLLKTDNTTFIARDVAPKSILIFFNPDCDHCQREAQAISEQKSIFKNYTLYFISIDQLPAIKKFSEDYKLQDGNFIFAQADGNAVYQTVGPLPSVPAIFIYNDYRLVKRLDGEVKIEEIAKYLQ